MLARLQVKILFDVAKNGLYDKPLFADRTAASIYKNVKNLDVSKYVNEDEE